MQRTVPLRQTYHAALRLKDLTLLAFADRLDDGTKQMHKLVNAH